MCTAISINSKGHLFLRTLDLDCSYGEAVICTPRSFRLDFRHEEALNKHYSILGVGCVFDNTPLYYDAFNEKGLAAAALNFPGMAVYFPKKEGKLNIASFELISWVLSQCSDVSEAVDLIKKVNITNDSFSQTLLTTPLHWIIADKSGSVTVESVAGGLEIYENPFGVLTNSPGFPYHAMRISDFLRIDSASPENKIAPSVNLSCYSKGLGATGLPGDYSSSSRFVRAVFLKNHSTAENLISHGFHVMENLAVPRGAVLTDDGKPFMTVYTSVLDTDNGVYYFTTAGSRRIRAVRLSEELMNESAPSKFKMTEEEKIHYLN